MSARSIDIARLEVWEEKWTAQELLNLLDEVVNHARALHELAPEKVAERADSLLGWIETRVGIVGQSIEDGIRLEAIA